MLSGDSQPGRKLRAAPTANDAHEQQRGAAQPGQALELVLPALAGDLPGGVDGVLEGGHQSQSRPQQAHDADDRGRLAAALGGTRMVSTTALAASPVSPSRSTTLPARSGEPAAKKPRTATANSSRGKIERKLDRVTADAM